MFKQFLTKRAIRFRRFLNRGYAAFCSMHREVSIGHISPMIANLELLKAGKAAALALFVFAPATLLYAEENTPPDGTDSAALLQLEEVNITAERSQFSSEQFRLVTNLTADQIQSMPIHTVSDLLKYVPGIDLRERGASGVQADLTIRGGTGRQVKVLLNGIDITDPQTDHYTMDIPVDVQLIERIEVLQGTNYALDAFSGAINIITKQSCDSLSSRSLTASLAAGEYGLINPVLAGRISKNNWWSNASASYNRSEGYQDDTDYQISNLYFQTGYKGFSFQAGGQMKDAGANSFYTVKYPNQFDQTRTLITSADYQHSWKNGWDLSGNIYYRAHFDRFHTYRNSVDMDGNPAPDWYTGPNITWTHTQGAHLESSWHNDFSKTTFGIDLRDELIHSTSLGDHNRLHLRYFATERFFYRNLSAALGASGIYNTQFGNDYSLGANIGYEPLRNWNLFLNFNRAIRVPTFTDLYYHTATQNADPLTRPEKALQLEFSSRYTYRLNSQNGYKPYLYANLSAFYRWGRDIIDWVKSPDPEVTVWESTNHSKVNSAGAELAFGVAGYKYIKKAEVNYAFCDVQSSSGDLLSLYALDYLRHKLVFSLEHKIYRGFGATWCFRIEDRAGEYTNKLGEVTPYKTCYLLDGSVYWENQFLRLALECRNITNTHYVDIGGVEQPPHWISGKITVQL